MRVYILVIEHRHGFDAWAHRSEAGALAKLAAYAREYSEDAWDKEALAASVVRNDTDGVVSAYFDGNEEEFYTIHEAELED